MAFPKKAKKVLGSSSCLRRKYINLFIRISGFRSVKANLQGEARKNYYA